uniref:Elongation of very long chain fatty acids protein n=1 Tax=Saccoglossus kowalevskii TaxID=10224 RepID=A0ABM0GII7_SACKO|nr:PREDICTED: putative fatty acid elongation protein 3-like [Saccoglossus kowalevskii]
MAANMSTQLYAFEQNFNDVHWVHWTEVTGVPIAIAASVVYVFVIFGLQHFMASRDRKELRIPLIVWNMCLAAFSIVALFRMLVSFRGVMSSEDGGWHYAICSKDHFNSEKVSGLWLFLFTLSKLPELGDTVFIGLRKSNLIFLHWYHHILTVCYTFWGYADRNSTAFVCTIMNLAVHSLMYSYYALRAARIKVPRIGAMAITSMQLLQMVAGTWIYYYVYKVHSRQEKCGISVTQWRVGLLMYVSYLILFANFFYQVYVAKKPRKPQIKRD